jgi:hypothetical protein
MCNLYNGNTNGGVVGICLVFLIPFGDGNFNGGSWLIDFVEKWLTQMYKKASSAQAKHLLFLITLLLNSLRLL